MFKTLALCGAITVMLPAAALAAQTQGSQAAAPGLSITPDQPKSSKSANGGGQDKTLTQALSQSNGTIQPPAVDPGITKTPSPEQRGNMPVLHPPATQQSK